MLKIIERLKKGGLIFMKLSMSKEVDLGKEPVKHLLWILAIPAITSQLVNALYNMVDRMYIGHIPQIGSTALTGVGVNRSRRLLSYYYDYFCVRLSRRNGRCP